MTVKPLLRAAFKLGLIALGGLVGAVAVVWIRANSDWVTVRLPSVMSPGSASDVEYEARVYAIVAISFAAGVLASVWVALAVWLRSIRRERALSRVLEKVERQVERHRELHRGAMGSGRALPPPVEGAVDRGDGAPLDEFAELDDDALMSEASDLPPGYGGVDEDEVDGELEDDLG